MKDGVRHSLAHEVPKVAALNDRNRVWRPERAAEVIAWIKRLVGCGISDRG